MSNETRSTASSEDLAELGWRIALALRPSLSRRVSATRRADPARLPSQDEVLDERDEDDGDNASLHSKLSRQLSSSYGRLKKSTKEILSFLSRERNFLEFITQTYHSTSSQKSEH